MKDDNEAEAEGELNCEYTETVSKVAYSERRLAAGNNRIGARALTEVRQIYSIHEGDESNSGPGDDVAEDDPEEDASDRTGKSESWTSRGD